LLRGGGAPSLRRVVANDVSARALRRCGEKARPEVAARAGSASSRLRL